MSDQSNSENVLPENSQEPSENLSNESDVKKENGQEQLRKNLDEEDKSLVAFQTEVQKNMDIYVVKIIETKDLAVDIALQLGLDLEKFQSLLKTFINELEQQKSEFLAAFEQAPAIDQSQARSSTIVSQEEENILTPVSQETPPAQTQETIETTQVSQSVPVDMSPSEKFRKSLEGNKTKSFSEVKKEIEGKYNDTIHQLFEDLKGVTDKKESILGDDKKFNVAFENIFENDVAISKDLKKFMKESFKDQLREELLQQNIGTLTKSAKTAVQAGMMGASFVAAQGLIKRIPVVGEGYIAGEALMSVGVGFLHGLARGATAYIISSAVFGGGGKGTRWLANRLTGWNERQETKAMIAGYSRMSEEKRTALATQMTQTFVDTLSFQKAKQESLEGWKKELREDSKELQANESNLLQEGKDSLEQFIDLGIKAKLTTKEAKERTKKLHDMRNDLKSLIDKKVVKDYQKFVEIICRETAYEALSNEQKITVLQDFKGYLLTQKSEDINFLLTEVLIGEQQAQGMDAIMKKYAEGGFVMKGVVATAIAGFVDAGRAVLLWGGQQNAVTGGIRGAVIGGTFGFFNRLVTGAITQGYLPEKRTVQQSVVRPGETGKSLQEYFETLDTLLMQNGENLQLEKVQENLKQAKNTLALYTMKSSEASQLRRRILELEEKKQSVEMKEILRKMNEAPNSDEKSDVVQTRMQVFVNEMEEIAQKRDEMLQKTAFFTVRGLKVLGRGLGKGLWNKDAMTQAGVAAVASAIGGVAMGSLMETGFAQKVLFSVQSRASVAPGRPEVLPIQPKESTMLRNGGSMDVSMIPKPEATVQNIHDKLLADHHLVDAQGAKIADLEAVAQAEKSLDVKTGDTLTKLLNRGLKGISPSVEQKFVLHYFPGKIINFGADGHPNVAQLAEAKAAFLQSDDAKNLVHEGAKVIFRKDGAVNVLQDKAIFAPSKVAEEVLRANYMREVLHVPGVKQENIVPGSLHGREFDVMLHGQKFHVEGAGSSDVKFRDSEDSNVFMEVNKDGIVTGASRDASHMISKTVGELSYKTLDELRPSSTSTNVEAVPEAGEIKIEAPSGTPVGTAGSGESATVVKPDKITPQADVTHAGSDLVLPVGEGSPSPAPVSPEEISTPPVVSPEQVTPPPVEEKSHPSVTESTAPVAETGLVKEGGGVKIQTDWKKTAFGEHKVTIGDTEPMIVNSVETAETALKRLDLSPGDLNKLASNPPIRAGDVYKVFTSQGSEIHIPQSVWFTKAAENIVSASHEIPLEMPVALDATPPPTLDVVPNIQYDHSNPFMVIDNHGKKLGSAEFTYGTSGEVINVTLDPKFQLPDSLTDDEILNKYCSAGVLEAMNKDKQHIFAKNSLLSLTKGLEKQSLVADALLVNDQRSDEAEFITKSITKQIEQFNKENQGNLLK